MELKENLVECENTYKVVGRLWNEESIEIISNGKDFFVLYGWNGEKYIDCWKVLDERGLNKSSDDSVYEIIPVYKKIEDEYQIVDFEII